MSPRPASAQKASAQKKPVKKTTKESARSRVSVALTKKTLTKKTSKTPQNNNHKDKTSKKASASTPSKSSTQKTIASSTKTSKTPTPAKSVPKSKSALPKKTPPQKPTSKPPKVKPPKVKPPKVFVKTNTPIYSTPHEGGTFLRKTEREFKVVESNSQIEAPQEVVDPGFLAADDVFDETDHAQWQQLREQAAIHERALNLNRPERHPDFNGKECVECGEIIPPARLLLHKVRCVDCQNELEEHNKRDQRLSGVRRDGGLNWGE